MSCLLRRGPFFTLRSLPRYYPTNPATTSSVSVLSRALSSSTTSPSPAAMAAAKPQKNEWLVLMQDKPDSLAARMKVRPQHLEELKPNIASGFWVFGGATLAAPPSESEGGKLDIRGSCMLGVADTKQEVLDMLKRDVYATAGVWDIENVQIIPFKCAVRSAL